MTAIAKEKAVGMLKEAIGKFRGDDLIQVYDELFPATPAPAEVRNDPTLVQNRILQHIDHGLEVEEILDLWSVVFPKDRNVGFDEDTGSIQINNEAKPFQYAD